MPEKFAYNIDQIDAKLISELEIDAGQPLTSIASKLGVTRPTIEYRLQRLQETGIISIHCLVNQRALGFMTSVVLLINARLDELEQVKDRLRSFGPVRSAAQCTGPFNIIAAALVRNHDELKDFLTNDIGTISGIAHVETMSVLKDVKFSTSFLAEQDGWFQLDHTALDLDGTDITILRELERDSRQTTKELAVKLGTSQATISRRIQRLKRDGGISVRALANPFALGFRGIAGISMKVDPAKVNQAADMVASYRNVKWVAICAGRYDIYAWVVFEAVKDLQRFISEELSKIPGLRDTTTMVGIDLVKYSYKFLTE